MIKKILLFISIAILSGCSLLLSLPTYYCYVDSYSTNKDFNINYVLQCDIDDEQNDEYLTNEVENYLNNLFSSKGFKLNSEYKPGITVIHYNYGLKVDFKEVKKLKPIMGVKGTTTTTTGKENYYSYDTRYSETSKTNVDRGIIGWDSYSTTKQIFKKGIVLEAISYDENNEVFNKYWKTTVYSESGGSDLRKMIPIMLESIKNYINVSTKESKKIIVEEYKGKLKVKD